MAELGQRALRVSRLHGPRELARRSLGLLDSSVAYLQQLRRGTVPGPLLLMIRAANEMASALSQHQSATPTPAQRRALLAAASQIRTMTHGIITTAQGRDPRSLEAELARLITRTLDLIDQVTAERGDLTSPTAPTIVVRDITDEPKLRRAKADKP